MSADVLPSDHRELVDDLGDFGLVLEPVPEISQEGSNIGTARAVREVVIDPETVFLKRDESGIFKYF